jgi:hypothetical protein
MYFPDGLYKEILRQTHTDATGKIHWMPAKIKGPERDDSKAPTLDGEDQKRPAKAEPSSSKKKKAQVSALNRKPEKNSHDVAAMLTKAAASKPAAAAAASAPRVKQETLASLNMDDLFGTGPVATVYDPCVKQFLVQALHSLLNLRKRASSAEATKALFKQTTDNLVKAIKDTEGESNMAVRLEKIKDKTKANLQPLLLVLPFLDDEFAKIIDDSLAQAQ